MIGRIRGTLIQRLPPYLVIDVQGVGYELEAPMSTFACLPAPGQEVTLYTQLFIRDEQPLLYGFSTLAERTLFRNLMRVSGIGARLALVILSGMSAAEFVQCVRAQDAARLVALPGVGKKTAQRLLVEMQDRLADALGADFEHAAAPGGAGVRGDAVSALIALGYKPREAERMVDSIDVRGLSSEEIIRRALQGMVQGG